MDSTPPAMNTSPSPAAIAWAARVDRLQPRAAQAVDGLARRPRPAARRAARPSARRCGCPRRPGWRSRGPRPRSSAGSTPVRSTIARDDDRREVVGPDARRARRRSGRSGCGPRRRSTPRGAVGGGPEPWRRLWHGNRRDRARRRGGMPGRPPLARPVARVRRPGRRRPHRRRVRRRGDAVAGGAVPRVPGGRLERQRPPASSGTRRDRRRRHRPPDRRRPTSSCGRRRAAASCASRP